MDLFVYRACYLISRRYLQAIQELRADAATNLSVGDVALFVEQYDVAETILHCFKHQCGSVRGPGFSAVSLYCPRTMVGG